MFQLTEEDIKEYQQIMRSDYGLEMDRNQAEQHGLWLLRLCESLFVKQDVNEKARWKNTFQKN